MVAYGPRTDARTVPAGGETLPEEPNYLAKAFKRQYNVIGLATALGFAVISGTWRPILVAAGIEMMVLPLVSGNERFRRLVD